MRRTLIILAAAASLGACAVDNDCVSRHLNAESAGTEPLTDRAEITSACTANIGPDLNKMGIFDGDGTVTETHGYRIIPGGAPGSYNVIQDY